MNPVIQVICCACAIYVPWNVCSHQLDGPSICCGSCMFSPVASEMILQHCHMICLSVLWLLLLFISELVWSASSWTWPEASHFNACQSTRTVSNLLSSNWALCRTGHVHYLRRLCAILALSSLQQKEMAEQTIWIQWTIVTFTWLLSICTKTNNKPLLASSVGLGADHLCELFLYHVWLWLLFHKTHLKKKCCTWIRKSWKKMHFNCKH